MLSDAKKKSQIIMEELQKRSRKCHDFVRKSFLSERIEHLELQEALKHYFSYWNDFTHPGLFSLACQAVGGQSSRTVQAQAALAMIAAAFDIHDDIVDKSHAKHGYPTVYGKFGEDIALLLGNAFLINGFTLLGKAASELPAEREREIFRVIKNCLFEVGNAHALELNLRGRSDVPPEKYMRILEMKSASIEADMQIAALFATGDRAKAEAMRKYGRALGTLATLREEFIDIFEPHELNQRVQSEALPLPVMCALQDAESRGQVKMLLEKRKLTAEDAQRLVGIVFDSEHVNTLRRCMRKLAVRSQHLISCVGDAEAKALLRNLTASMLEDL